MRNVDTGHDGFERMLELDAQDRDKAAAKKAADDEAKKNRDFTQVYPKGWRRLQQLMRESPSAARLYAFLAEHMDGGGGVVVASQELIGRELDIHKRTVIRLSAELEKQGAIVRIRVGTGTYAYALDPSEVWKSWDSKKQTAAFLTKTLVLKGDRANQEVRRKLKVMMGEPELPLGGET